jgi:ABC-2 type transport system permease protein
MTNPAATFTPTEAGVATVPSGPVKVYPLRDTATMLRRNLKQQLRDKVAVAAIIGIPVLFLLLFVYVFGGALEQSVTGVAADNYVNYVLPGLIIMTAAAELIGTSTQTSVDMSAGIISRFRTMPIFQPSILIARVLSSVIQALVSMAVVVGIAFAMGLSPNATFIDWIALLGFLAYASFCLCLLGLAFGLAAKTVGSASNGPFPLILLPLVSSGIVLTSTMPVGIRYFADYQPFTPMVNTVRGLLFGTHIGSSYLSGLAWATGFGVLGLYWSIKAFNRERKAIPGPGFLSRGQ